MKDYLEAGDVEEVAKKLLKTNQYLLDNKISEAKVYYLFKLKTVPYRAKCSLTTGKWKYLTNCDYVIEVEKEVWDGMDDKAREALVLHELLHIGRKEEKEDEDGEKKDTKWEIRHHDIEEFEEVVRQHGCWREELDSFKKALGGDK